MGYGFLHFNPAQVTAVYLSYGDYDHERLDVATQAEIALAEDGPFIPFLAKVKVPMTMEGWPPDLAPFAQETTRRGLLRAACERGFVPAMDWRHMLDWPKDLTRDAYRRYEATAQKTIDLIVRLGHSSNLRDQVWTALNGHYLVGVGPDFLAFRSPTGVVRALLLQDVERVRMDWPETNVEFVFRPGVTDYPWLEGAVAISHKVPEDASMRRDMLPQS